MNGFLLDMWIIKMPKIILTREKHIINIFNESTGKMLRYNLKEMSLQKYDASYDKWFNVERQYAFFKNCSIYDLVCPEEKFSKLIEKSRHMNSNCSNLSTFISRLNYVMAHENFINAGIRTPLTSSRYGRRNNERSIKRPYEWYTKHMIKFLKKFDIEVTVSVEQTFEKKYNLMEKIVVFLLDCEYRDNDIKDLFRAITGNNSRDDEFFELVERYNYEIKSLINYLLGYLRPFENLAPYNSLHHLRDYYRMASQIGRDVKKYPKYLRSMHDIITSNFNAYKKEYSEELFLKTRREELDYSEDEFSIITPRSPKEIISEGTDLNHCVGSYIENILEGKTCIFFLRRTDEKEKSLITLELKNNCIVQAKGSRNRSLDSDERKFLNKYCKKLNLELSI